MSTVESLLNQIKTAEKQLQEIRDNCPHNKGYYVAYWSYRIGHKFPARICNYCRDYMDGELTEKEEMQCQAEGSNYYSDVDGGCLFKTNQSLKTYEGKFIGYTYDDGVIVSEDSFEKA